MLNFTVGPVQTNSEILAVGSQQVPYFRTEEFSKIMIENEKLMLEFSGAARHSRVVFLTGSGTAAMEAAVINTLDRSDKALVVNGGGFGQRFADLLALHEIPFDEIKPAYGKGLTEEDLMAFDNKDYTAFLVNIHETSTGVHYDLDLIGRFCNKNNLFLIVDAISSFLADELNMKNHYIDLMITGSQKALSCPPGVSIAVLSPAALERVDRIKTKCMYLDFKSALKNAERGQTPFTPAVSILLQINCRLKQIQNNGGVSKEIENVKRIAEDFRSKIVELPFTIVSDSLSNALTPLHPLNASAFDIFLELKNNYGIWVCPNGGDQKDLVFRVGHIGCLTISDNDKLISSLRDLQKKGII